MREVAHCTDFPKGSMYVKGQGEQAGICRLLQFNTPW
jgi:hypothetical protein